MKYVGPLIVVKDMKVARDFYENYLGQKVKFDFGENVSFEGDFSIHLERHFEKLLEFKDGKILRKSNNFELYFETEDIDPVYQKLKEADVEFVHEIREQPWGQRVMRFYDPDAHIIEVGQTMESVVIRYFRTGMSIEDICKKTFMPKEFVHHTLAMLED